MTATTKVANEHGCSTCYSRNVPSRFYRGLKQSSDGREYEQRFGKTLDEDVKIGVVLALAKPLPLELTYPEELRASQDDAVRLLPSTSGYGRW